MTKTKTGVRVNMAKGNDTRRISYFFTLGKGVGLIWTHEEKPVGLLIKEPETGKGRGCSFKRECLNSVKKWPTCLIDH
jgi:hypothetical protein